MHTQPPSLRCSRALEMDAGNLEWARLGRVQGGQEQQVLGFPSLYNSGVFPFLEESLSLDTH